MVEKFLKNCSPLTKYKDLNSRRCAQLRYIFKRIGFFKFAAIFKWKKWKYLTLWLFFLISSRQLGSELSDQILIFKIDLAIIDWDLRAPAKFITSLFYLWKTKIRAGGPSIYAPWWATRASNCSIKTRSLLVMRRSNTHFVIVKI
jgi:hypothetical protein